ncbi:hypothetical protein [Kytococcus sedentarius]|uniref:hypothetical protein n=1 Tax=Kytococcus sedentarius TaxID=1276 RepID=UPI0035BC894A
MYVVVLPLAALIALAVVMIGRAAGGGGRPAPVWMVGVAAAVMALVAVSYAMLGTVFARTYDADGLEALNAPFAASLMVLLVPAVVLTVMFFRQRTTHRFTAAMVAAALGLLLVLGTQL